MKTSELLKNKKKQELIPSKILGSEKLFKGYPRGSIINIVAVPKAGKTTWGLEEAILMAKEGKDVLYMYNESPKERFSDLLAHRLLEMNISQSEIEECLTWEEMRDKDGKPNVLYSAQYESIVKFVENVIMPKITGWLKNTKNPTLVVVDSLSKFCRTYTAQAFYFAQAFTTNIWKTMVQFDRYPVILTINQKSGGKWERDDESVLGGMGIVHEMDASIVITKHIADKWTEKDRGLSEGNGYRMVRVEGFRDVDCSEDEYLLLKENGHLKIGDKFTDLFGEDFINKSGDGRQQE